jgi:predicted nucleotidyltransferase component of viral defense system
MAAADGYRTQVGLLVQALPLVAVEPAFALKGGTAINLFIRDLPRLSVDIDLIYLPVEDRSTSFANIDAAMRRIASAIESGIVGSRTQVVPLHSEGAVTKILVNASGVQIKIEVTPVLRGCVYPPERRRVRERVEESFGYAEIAVVSFSDLYAGKIVAALDRQHPRDLFDVRDLLTNEGISGDLRRAFIVYILSHNRPMAEVLAPRLKDIQQEFETGFVGMTQDEVTLQSLYEARGQLIAKIVGEMPDAHRRFLLSFKTGDPDWQLLGIPHAEKLPAVRWKVDNLAKLPDARRKALLADLEKVFAQ